MYSIFTPNTNAPVCRVQCNGDKLYAYLTRPVIQRESVSDENTSDVVAGMDGRGRCTRAFCQRVITFGTRERFRSVKRGRFFLSKTLWPKPTIFKSGPWSSLMISAKFTYANWHWAARARAGALRRYFIIIEHVNRFSCAPWFCAAQWSPSYMMRIRLYARNFFFFFYCQREITALFLTVFFFVQ